MAGINDILAGLAERAAKIDALKARIGTALDDFVARASYDQAALFAAACAERAAGILLWKASSEGRRDEADAYLKALEQAWRNPIEGEPITTSTIEGMYELTHHDEPIRKEPLYKAGGFAEYAALALLSALSLNETSTVEKVRGASSALWQDAAHLEHHTGTAQESQEVDRQIADMARLLRDGATEESKAALRQQSREVARIWLDLAAAHAES